MEGVSSYIDRAMVGGISSGVLLGVGVAWVLFAQNALWRIHLRALSTACFQTMGEDRRFSLWSARFAPQIHWLGTVEGEPFVLKLKGGIQGVRVQLERGSGTSDRQAWLAWGSLEGGPERWLSDRLGRQE